MFKKKRKKEGNKRVALRRRIDRKTTKHTHTHKRHSIPTKREFFMCVFYYIPYVFFPLFRILKASFVDTSLYTLRPRRPRRATTTATKKIYLYMRQEFFVVCLFAGRPGAPVVKASRVRKKWLSAISFSLSSAITRRTRYKLERDE